MSLHCWSSPRYAITLPDGHRFPMAKYALLREGALASGLVAPSHLHEPERVAHADLLRVHTRSYVDGVEHGRLEPAHQRRIGLPWSEAFVERAFRVVRGTVEAAAHAVEHGIAMNLAGGTHHAFADRGEGFCVFNDVAVAVRALRDERLARRVAIIDLDVHQGNGTHAIFAGDNDTYTFSMHGEKNFPFRKVPGTLDIGLPDRTTDEPYLALLADALPPLLRTARADIVFLLAGADPHEGDALGRLALSFDGLRRRDRMVIEQCRDIGLPVAIVIAGGYGRNIDDTVAVHLGTGAIAREFA